MSFNGFRENKILTKTLVFKITLDIVIIYYNFKHCTRYGLHSINTYWYMYHNEINTALLLSRSAPRLESWSLSWTNHGTRISSYQILMRVGRRTFWTAQAFLRLVRLNFNRNHRIILNCIAAKRHYKRYNLSNATSSIVLSMTIAKLERIPRTTLRQPTSTTHNGSKNKY